MATDPNKIDEVTLDMSIDDIEDLPSFLQPPTGAYILVLNEGIVEKTLETADKEDSDIFELAFTIKEILEFDKADLDEGEDPPKVGDTYTVSFQRTNKFGMGYFKEVVKPIADRIGSKQLGNIIGASKGMEFMALLTRTFNKAKKKDYTRIRKIELT